MIYTSKFYFSKLIPRSFFILILFLINPTIALLVSAFVAFSSKGNDEVLIFMVTIAMWLGVVNMTKIPSSDQIHYLEWYQNVERSSFWDSVVGFRSGFGLGMSEPAFNIFSVIIFYLSNGNAPFYFFSITVIAYLFHFLAIKEYVKSSNFSNQYIYLGVLVHAFCWIYFIQSVHAIRQILAGALMIYAIAKRNSTGKNAWLIIIIAVLTHVTSIFYLVLGLIPALYDTDKIKRAIIWLVAALLICIMGSGALAVLFGNSDMETLAMIGEKVGGLNNSSEGRSEMMSLASLYIYSIPFFLLSIIQIINRNNQPTNSNIYAYFFIFTFIFIMLFSNNPTIRSRFFIYMESFMPFIIITFCGRIKSIGKLLCVLLPSIYILLFFFYFKLPSSYAKMSEIITSSFFHFLSYSY